MAKLTIEEAAEAVGKSRQTIWRATQSGKLSAEKNEQGVTVIDASELDRVYPIRPAWLKRQSSDGDDGAFDAERVADATAETPRNIDRSALEGEIKLWRERFDMTGQVHAERVKALQARIEELMEDRNDLRAERDSLLTTLQEQAVSVRLLTHHQSTVQTAPTPGAEVAAVATTAQRRGFFGLFKRG